MDMRFYWLRDRVSQQQFRVCWKKGALILADYFTKHHPASHHQQSDPLPLMPRADPSCLDQSSAHNADKTSIIDLLFSSSGHISMPTGSRSGNEFGWITSQLTLSERGANIAPTSSSIAFHRHGQATHAAKDGT
jgi:hypothetical protein